MNCENKATWAVPWGGKIIKCCAKHLDKMLLLAGTIGSPIKTERIFGEVKCVLRDEDNESRGVDETN